MSIHSIQRYVIWIPFAVSIYCLGCGKRGTLPETEPIIKRIAAKNDLSRALGVDLVKYEYDLSGLSAPKGNLVSFKVWMELLQDDKQIRQWPSPNIVCGNSGSILLAYYKPPLFTNEEETIKAKIIINAQSESSIDISLNMPFRYQAFIGGIQKEVIEMDREYILSKIVEIYSPQGKGIVHPDGITDRDKSENKALILKVKFGLVDG